MKFPLILLACILYSVNCQSAIVDTVVINSASMKKNIKCVVIKPDAYETKNLRFPVVYLLHGAGGSYSNWITRVPSLKNLADKYQILIVCPDGHPFSWYLDSPLDPSMKYETFIGLEVPKFIDENYKTFQNRNGRAIAGLSMGGYGSLRIAFHHSKNFGACGSMSGAMDFSFSGNKVELMKIIGDTIKNAENWKKYSLVNMVASFRPSDLAIIIDCGTEDQFFNVNKKVHGKLQELKIPHDFIERPGKHDWDYWKNAVEYQLLFFRKFFDKKII